MAEWTTELQKASNDALRQAGDVVGIVTKYQAPTGPPSWQDTQLADVMTVIQSSYAGWSNPDANTLKNNLLPGGVVELSRAAVRNFIQGLITADEVAQLTESFSTRQSLASALDLPEPSAALILEVLHKLPDSPQGGALANRKLIQSIRRRVRDGELQSTSPANLATIDTLLGA